LGQGRIVGIYRSIGKEKIDGIQVIDQIDIQQKYSQSDSNSQMIQI
jgi:hypothetical protein